MKKIHAILVPVLAFLAAFGLTTWLLRSRASTTVASMGILAGPAKVKSPDELATERAALISELRSFLRAGDVEGARKLLSESASDDPEFLFLALEKLPSFPGVEDQIKEAAARLPWKEKRITALLNRIASPTWRDLAWEAYAGARVGKVSNEEIFLTAIPARRSNWTAGLKTLMEAAAADRPEEFMDLLNREGGSSFREAFMEIAMKVHPEKGADLYRSIPATGPGSDYDRTYALQARVVALPTAANLKESLADGGSRVGYSPLGSNLAGEAYSRAEAGERQKMREDMASLPALERGRLLRGPLFQSDHLTAEDLSALLDLSPSSIQQREGLASWLVKHPEAAENREWIEALPSEGLRAQADEWLSSNGPKDH